MKKRMDGFAKFITRHKILIVSLALLLTVLSLVALTFVQVNSNIFDYLPDDMQMSQGLDYIKTAFGMEGDAIVGVSGITYSQLKSKITEIEKLKGVSKGGALWLGSMYEMKNLDISSMLDEYAGNSAIASQNREKCSTITVLTMENYKSCRRSGIYEH